MLGSLQGGVWVWFGWLVGIAQGRVWLVLHNRPLLLPVTPSLLMSPPCLSQLPHSAPLAPRLPSPLHQVKRDGAFIVVQNGSKHTSLDKEVLHHCPMMACGDVSKRQGTVSLALSGALTNGHRSHLSEQILVSSQRIVSTFIPKAIASIYSIYGRRGWSLKAGRIRNVRNLIWWMGYLMRNQVNTV